MKRWRRGGRWLFLVGAVGLLLTLRLVPAVVPVVCNNLGSLFINRALLAARSTAAQPARSYLRAGLRWDAAPDPLAARLYTNVATLHVDAAQVDAAERALRHAAVLAPDAWRAQFWLGELLAARGEWDAALEAWRAAGAAEYLLQQGQALVREGDVEAAVRVYERALAVQPDLTEGYEYLGRALNRLGFREEALTAFSSAVALEPERSPHRYLLQAEIHVAREAWEDAVASYQRAAALDRWNAKPLYRSGRLRLEQLHDLPGAVDDFERAVARDPEHAGARLALAMIYKSRGACGDVGYWLGPLLAEETADRDAARAHALLGTCLLSQADARGLWYLERSVALRPERIDYRLALAQGYQHLGDVQQAKAAYREVLERAPQNAEAQQALEALEGDGP